MFCEIHHSETPRYDVSFYTKKVTSGNKPVKLTFRVRLTYGFHSFYNNNGFTTTEFSIATTIDAVPLTNIVFDPNFSPLEPSLLWSLLAFPSVRKCFNLDVLEFIIFMDL